MQSNRVMERNFCDTFIKENVINRKGENFKDRFIDIISDPNNLLIKRVPDAGKIIDGNVILHQGIKVSAEGYYGDFSECLQINHGVHEPSEERMFQEVLNDIDEGATMIELGSYWAMYTIWFSKMIKGSINYCIEPESSNIKVGIDNCKLNDVSADFTLGFIGNSKGQIKVSDFIKEKKIDFIDMLHSDIQGYELHLLHDMVPLMKNKKIKYLFISTHSNEIHYEAIRIMKECGYRIICSSDFLEETFCMDGIIVACQKDNLTITETSLGNRSKTPLRHEPYPISFYGKATLSCNTRKGEMLI
tara:strand:+ start:113 stop:1021 length:909 start_codon:yes stop_codon:yes gene_type:complete